MLQRRAGGGGGGIGCVFSFKYLGVFLDQQRNWKLHISSLSKKLGHRLSVFNRILHMLDKRTRLAYFNAWLGSSALGSRTPFGEISLV